MNPCKLCKKYNYIKLFNIYYNFTLRKCKENVQIWSNEKELKVFLHAVFILPGNTSILCWKLLSGLCFLLLLYKFAAQEMALQWVSSLNIYRCMMDIII